MPVIVHLSLLQIDIAKLVLPGEVRAEDLLAARREMSLGLKALEGAVGVMAARGWKVYARGRLMFGYHPELVSMDEGVRHVRRLGVPPEMVLMAEQFASAANRSDWSADSPKPFPLLGEGRELRVDETDWHYALRLAHQRGWGLPEEEFREEDGGDVTLDPDDEDLEEVRLGAGDAFELAAALKSALPDVPTHDALAEAPDAVPATLAEKLLLIAAPGPGPKVRVAGAVEWFSGLHKERLRRIIQFCRQGGFAYLP